jgi:hypothetical protein
MKLLYLSAVLAALSSPVEDKSNELSSRATAVLKGTTITNAAGKKLKIQ